MLNPCLFLCISVELLNLSIILFSKILFCCIDQIIIWKTPTNTIQIGNGSWKERRDLWCSSMRNIGGSGSVTRYGMSGWVLVWLEPSLVSIKDCSMKFFNVSLSSSITLRALLVSAFWCCTSSSAKFLVLLLLSSFDRFWFLTLVSTLPLALYFYSQDFCSSYFNKGEQAGFLDDDCCLPGR